MRYDGTDSCATVVPIRRYCHEMDFINYGDKIIYCAMYLYIGYVNEATNFAESQGGGGTEIKDWGRDKDEDEIEWIRRCLRQATRMVKPRRGKGLNR